MVWLLPFVAAVEGPTAAWSRPLFLLAAGLTTAIYPWRAGGLERLAPGGIALLNIRNALLVVLLIIWLFPCSRTGNREVTDGMTP